MPHIAEVIKEDAAAIRKVMSDTATDMRDKVGPEIRDEIMERVDAARKIVSDVAADVSDKFDARTDDHERTLFEKITDPVKEIVSYAVDFVKNTLSSK